jgi:hypothetical protein
MFGDDLLYATGDVDKFKAYKKALDESTIVPKNLVEKIPAAMEDLSTDLDVLNLARLVAVAELYEQISHINELAAGGFDFSIYHSDVPSGEQGYSAALERVLMCLLPRVARLSKCELEDLPAVLFGVTSGEVDNPFDVVDASSPGE